MRNAPAIRNGRASIRRSNRAGVLTAREGTVTLGSQNSDDDKERNRCTSALYGDAIQAGNGNVADAVPMWLKRLVESILLGPAPLPAFFQRSPRSAFFIRYSIPPHDS